MSAHDEALVTELAELAAESLGWDWDERAIGDTFYPSGPDTIRPEVEAILDRLVEIGWKPGRYPICGEQLSPGRVCTLGLAHGGDWRNSEPGGVSWPIPSPPSRPRSDEALAAAVKWRVWVPRPESLCAARLSTGPDAWLLCILHEGHTADHRSGDVTWMGAW